MHPFSAIEKAGNAFHAFYGFRILHRAYLICIMAIHARMDVAAIRMMQ